MKLNEIVAGFDAFEAAMEANQGELTPELAQTLDALHLAEKTKVDGLVFYLKALQGEADALAKLGDEIHAKRQAKLAKKESLMRYVRWYMEQRQAEKLAGEHFRFQFVASGKPPVEVLVPVEELPREWVTVSIVPNKEKIRESLAKASTPDAGQCQMGDEFDPMLGWFRVAALARLGEPTLSLRVF